MNSPLSLEIAPLATPSLIRELLLASPVTHPPSIATAATPLCFLQRFTRWPEKDQAKSLPS